MICENVCTFASCFSWIVKNNSFLGCCRCETVAIFVCNVYMRACAYMCACGDAEIVYFSVCVDVQDVETFDFWRFLGAWCVLNQKVV